MYTYISFDRRLNQDALDLKWNFGRVFFANGAARTFDRPRMPIHWKYKQDKVCTQSTQYGYLLLLFFSLYWSFHGSVSDGLHVRCVFRCVPSHIKTIFLLPSKRPHAGRRTH